MMFCVSYPARRRGRNPLLLPSPLLALALTPALTAAAAAAAYAPLPLRVGRCEVTKVTSDSGCASVSPSLVEPGGRCLPAETVRRCGSHRRPFLTSSSLHALSHTTSNEGDVDAEDCALALRRSFRHVAASALRGPPPPPNDGGGLFIDATNGCSGATDVRAINSEIVRRGLEFVERTKVLPSSPGDGCSAEEVARTEGLDVSAVEALISETERVPGCVANVRVRSTLTPLFGGGSCSAAAPLVGDESDGGRGMEGVLLQARPEVYHVTLDGDADALLSRGLLALLSEALRDESVTAADVLEVDPAEVASLLGLRTVLSKGRNDGLAGMIEVVQGQIRKLLIDHAVANGDNHDAVAVIGSIDGGDDDDDRPTVAMLLSGGVDSSVALNLLLRQNYKVTAFYLRIWLEDELAHLGQCPWEDDYAVCRAVCEQAGVPLETVSLQEQYKERVISYTVDEARRGRTPNPDVMCNSRVKFGCFYDAIEGRGFEYVASGHYARLERGSDTGEGVVMRLHCAPDPVKDQSYFLSALTQAQLCRIIFPLGDMQKSEVRALARELRLPNRDRPDSQGLCFLGKVKFDEFLSAYLGDDPGDIVDAADWRVIGRHRGLWYHTVGQRKGIGPVLDPIETSRGPWYVVAKDPGRNTIVVSNRYDEEVFQKARSDFYVEDISWIGGKVPTCLRASTDYKGARLWKDMHFDIKIRHGPTIVGGTLSLDEAVPEGNAGNVRLDAKDKGLAPGQFCVFYDGDGDECLGSGIISERHWASFLMTGEMAGENGLSEKEALRS